MRSPNPKSVSSAQLSRHAMHPAQAPAPYTRPGQSSLQSPPGRERANSTPRRRKRRRARHPQRGIAASAEADPYRRQFAERLVKMSCDTCRRPRHRWRCHQPWRSRDEPCDASFASLVMQRPCRLGGKRRKSLSIKAHRRFRDTRLIGLSHCEMPAGPGKIPGGTGQLGSSSRWRVYHSAMIRNPREDPAWIRDTVSAMCRFDA